VKLRDVIARLESDGWTYRQGPGGHRIYTHQTKSGRVIVSMHGANVDIKLGTLNSIKKAAGWK
jgi:predicted RNA binding protein YcfA (HicA-like mRNA interferase family)